MSTNLSLVIPVFNEEKRLNKLFLALDDYISKPIIPLREIIFVDDGSTDGTKQSILDFQKKCLVEVVVVSYTPNQGKGNAVREGMLRAQGDYVLMFDADVSTPLGELSKFVGYLNEGVPILIGSRKLSGAKVVKSQKWLRQKMGEAYAVLARLVTGLKVQDFGCGFKIFSKESARVIFSSLVNKGWIFDTEALYLAKKNGILFKEIGIDWSNDEESKVKVLSGTISSIFGLLYIRLCHSKLWRNFFRK
ncbi:MAG TPA: dolichyl-phosphate beta-glucosyltransferase [Patescibacteria group bacterium]|nr:dolichyl-phosphate beta-glucosyltransferase [Patescibacteria group bacterium]